MWFIDCFNIQLSLVWFTQFLGLVYSSNMTCLVLSGLVLAQFRLCYVGFCHPGLHALAEGVQLVVEVLGGLGHNQTGIQARVPDATEAQWNLLDQIVDRVALHAHRLVGVKVDALLRHRQDAKIGTSKPRDGHQVMGPHSVT